MLAANASVENDKLIEALAKGGQTQSLLHTTDSVRTLNWLFFEDCLIC